MNRIISLVVSNIVPISIGLIYLVFGFLKFFPGASPAEELAVKTINEFTFNYVPSAISIKILAVFEVSVGLLLISNYFKRITISVALLHMTLTFTPLIFFPELSFKEEFYLPTLHGQYIFKNVIIISALISIYPFKKAIICRSDI